jgi:hypothetical protein
MGREVAKQASVIFKNLKYDLAYVNSNFPLEPYYFSKYNVFSFPVKRKGHEIADMELIISSAHKLVELVELRGFQKVFMPKPGCGNGKLLWEDVKPKIDFLDDGFHIVDL